MALINCSECNKEVSDKAAACPNCGAPIGVDKESVGSGVQHLTTTQGTSKALKAQQFISMLLIFVGGVGMFASYDPGFGPLRITIIITAVGLIWYFAVRLRIWWHHG